MKFLLLPVIVFFIEFSQPIAVRRLALEEKNDQLTDIKDPMNNDEEFWFRKKRNIDNDEEISKIEGLKYRLPTNIVPKHYTITIIPHMIPNNFTFDGFVKITTQVVQNSIEIVLHVDNITIESVNLETNGSSIQIDNVNHDDKYEFLRITAAKTITSGSDLIIKIKYLGYMNEEKRGLYRNFYIDKFNQTKWFAVTHLVPIRARRVFPCFDEPALRATFQLKVNRTADFKALSITPLNSTIKENDRYLDIFEKTPVISTYSLGFALSEFSSVNEVFNYFDWTKNASPEVVVSYITRNVTEFQFYEQFWTYRNQLENWNLIAYNTSITHNQSIVLANANYVPYLFRQEFQSDLAYETAYGYYRYEMSPSWWNNVWLSNGYSRFIMSTIKKNKSHEHWHRDEIFVVDQLQLSMVDDSLPTSHPVSYDVYNADQIISIFDDTLCIKSASIIRAMRYIIGVDALSEAMNNYFWKKRFQATNPDDLYPHLQDTINEDKSIEFKLNTSVKSMMDSWVIQPGYPVVHVKINKSNVTFSQERFLLNNPDKVSINKVWWIPITWVSSSNPNFTEPKPKYYLSKANDTIVIDEVDDNGWIVFNIQQAGYYRVNYDEDSWYRLIKALKSPNFGNIDRINRGVLVDDLFNFARAGYIDYGIALSAAEYLTEETEYVSWTPILNDFAFLDKQITDRNIHDLFKRYVVKNIEPVYKKYGFERRPRDNYFHLVLRGTIIDWVCKYGHNHCVESSLKLFNNWRSDSSQLVNVNLRGSVFCTAVKYGPENNWEYLWNKYLEANYQTEKITIINALACTMNKTKLRQLLLNAIDRKSGLRYEDSLTVFSAVYSVGRLGAQQALDIISDHYDDIYNYYNKDYDKIKTVLKGLSNYLTTQRLVWQFNDFISKNSKKFKPIKRAVEVYITQAYENFNWHDKYSKSISKYLNISVSDYQFPNYRSAAFAVVNIQLSFSYLILIIFVADSLML